MVLDSKWAMIPKNEEDLISKVTKMAKLVKATDILSRGLWLLFG